MLEHILPERLTKILNMRLNKNYIYELRIRANKPVVINYMGKYECLAENGITKDKLNAIRLSQTEIKNIILKAANYSIYAVNEQIKEGYLCVNNGIRIGICGQLVIENNEIKTINNINSINIRIPHQILNCSLNAFPFLTSEGKLLNTLIISPPGAGKTTFIRDICYQISKQDSIENVLVLDERNEIANLGTQNNFINIGDYCDILTHCTKMYGFQQGIRSMKPDLIVTDEIASSEDVNAIEYACSCGINVLATIHANDLNDLKIKKNLNDCLTNKVFKRYVVLSNRKGPMTFEGIFDENFRCLWIS